MQRQANEITKESSEGTTMNFGTKALRREDVYSENADMQGGGLSGCATS
ncbi:hypothetical protein [Undibacterium luofuense]|jgi:hypothetical protein